MSRARIEQVREHDEQRARAHLRLKERHRGAVVGGRHAGLERVHRARQLARAAAAAGGAQEGARRVVEGHEPRFVAAAKRDVGGEERGVERVVDAGEPAALAPHPAPHVEREHDVLVRLGLELADGEIVPPRRRAPVDVSDLVPTLVGAKTLELGVAAAHAHAPEACILPPLAPEHLERARGVDVGVDIHFGGELGPLLARDQPERRVVTDGHSAELSRASARRASPS